MLIIFQNWEILKKQIKQNKIKMQIRILKKRTTLGILNRQIKLQLKKQIHLKIKILNIFLNNWIKIRLPSLEKDRSQIQEMQMT